MSEQDVIAALHKAAEDLRKEYSSQKEFLEDDRDEYNYNSGKAAGVTDLLYHFYMELFNTRK